jgi:hypothetical protein
MNVTMDKIFELFINDPHYKFGFNRD